MCITSNNRNTVPRAFIVSDIESRKEKEVQGEGKGREGREGKEGKGEGIARSGQCLKRTKRVYHYSNDARGRANVDSAKEGGA